MQEQPRPDAALPGTDDAPPGADAGPPPVPRKRIFTVIAFALLMMSVDGTIVATALHTLQVGLDTTVNWAGWTLTAYSLGFMVMLPISGKLSERYGQRRVFLGSVATFTGASLLCGLAGNITTLIILRACQAAGGAGFTPSATGIIVDHFGDERDRAVGLFGSIFPVGAMIGPIFGGLFVTYWSWRGIFFVNLPIGILVFIFALRYIPADRPRPRPRNFSMDIPGMLLLATGILGGMLAASYLGEPGARLTSPAFLVPMLAALFGLWSFFHHVHHVRAPFILPRLIHGRDFGIVNLVNAIFGGVAMGAISLAPLYATNRYGLDAISSGTLLIAQGLAAVLLSVIAAFLLRRTGYRRPILVGALFMAGGMVLLGLTPLPGFSPYVWLAGAAFLVGAGSGIVNPASRNAGLQLAPQHASTLAALRSLSMQVGGIATISITTAILAGAADAGIAQAMVYVALAIFLVLMLPLSAHVPEHRGAW